VDLRQLLKTVSGRKLSQNLDTERTETLDQCFVRTTRGFFIHTIFSFLAQLPVLLQRYEFEKTTLQLFSMLTYFHHYYHRCSVKKIKLRPTFAATGHIF